MLFCEDCGTLKERRKTPGGFEAVCPDCEEGNGSSSSRSSGAPVATRKRRRAPSEATTESDADRDRHGTEPPSVDVPDDAQFFPFDEVRPGQDDLLEDVRSAIADGGHLVAYAPTGLGKTAATVAPALRHALEEGRRVFFLTSTQSQHEIAVETLQRIRARTGIPFVVADVIGKQDMCARREADDMSYREFADFCMREQANGTCTYWENDDADAVAAFQREVLPVEEIVDKSKQTFHVCPHRAALDLAARAHAVVCDYNYFFSDLRDQMTDRLDVDLEDAVLIVDEAHNLPGRIRDHLAVRLHGLVLRDASEELRDLASQGLAVEHLIEACGILDDLVANRAADLDANEAERPVERDDWVEAVEERLGTVTTVDYDRVVEELSDAIDEFEDAFRQTPDALQRVRSFLRNWRNDRSGLIRYVEGGTVPALVYQLLDPRILARPVFGAVHASVTMSGTLYPTRMYRDVLGLDPDRTTLRDYDDPFPEDCRRVVVDRSVTTRYEARDEAMFDRIAERLGAVAEATPGNVAAFFPSYAILDRVRSRLAWEVDDVEIVAEERSQDKVAKHDLVQALRGRGRSLLMGVMGGSLSEGIDYDDNVLSTVVVVGVPFARPTTSTQALIDHYEEAFGDRGYLYAYVHPAINRVLQAVGRPIRKAEDRAAIVLMDERFAWNRYRWAIPDDLAPEVVDDPAAEVAAFWRSAKTDL